MLLPSLLSFVHGAARMSPRQEAEAKGGEEDQGDERFLLHGFRTGEEAGDLLQATTTLKEGRAFRRKPAITCKSVNKLRQNPVS